MLRQSTVFDAILETVLSPLTLVASLWLRYLRHRIKSAAAPLPISRSIFRRVGVFPIIRAFDEPLFDHVPGVSDQEPRELPGLDMNLDGQLDLLSRMNFQDELRALPLEAPAGEKAFYFHNGYFEAGDAEMLYNLVRLIKPARIIELGCGYSTLAIRKALQKNQEDDPGHDCRHLAVEPFANPWLERAGLDVIRKKAEDMPLEFFQQLSAGDILFIDTAHIIRPDGDVLRLLLQVLPSVPSGVYVHVHDIFTPRDYPAEWRIDRVRFYSEQYLLEAFMSCNRDFKLVAALNYLKHDHFNALAACCPILAQEPGAEPGSFWMVRN